MDRIHALMNTDEWRKNEAPSVNFQVLMLFVSSMVGPKQNAGSILTPISDSYFHVPSHGSLGAFNGSFFNHSES